MLSVVWMLAYANAYLAQFNVEAWLFLMLWHPATMLMSVWVYQLGEGGN